MAKNEKTSAEVAKKAAKILRDPKSTKAQKSVAASALAQAPDKSKAKTPAKKKTKSDQKNLKNTKTSSPDKPCITGLCQVSSSRSFLSINAGDEA